LFVFGELLRSQIRISVGIDRFEKLQFIATFRQPFVKCELTIQVIVEFTVFGRQIKRDSRTFFLFVGLANHGLRCRLSTVSVAFSAGTVTAAKSAAHRISEIIDIHAGLNVNSSGSHHVFHERRHLINLVLIDSAISVSIQHRIESRRSVTSVATKLRTTSKTLESAAAAPVTAPPASATRTETPTFGFPGFVRSAKSSRTLTPFSPW
jgi:hypothetical protein